MKLIKDDKVYLFPEEDTCVILVDNKASKQFVDCLYDFFGRKKKNTCRIVSDDGQIILPSELNFIWINNDVSLESNMELKSKSIFNQELTKLIEENQEMFFSVDHVRNDIHGLLTDRGFFKIEKILSKGIIGQVDFELSDFNVSKLLEMLSIRQDDLNDTKKILMIYNLLLYISRNQNNMVYLDFPITNEVISWVQCQRTNNCTFILKNDISRDTFKLLNDCTLVKLSNAEYKEEYECEHDELPKLSYVFNPFVIDHLDQQSEENQRLYEQYEDEDTTFFLKVQASNLRELA